MIKVESPPKRQAAWPFGGAELIAALLLAATLLSGRLDSLLSGDALRNWVTVFVAISLQAIPFLVGGVVVSGAIAAFLPPGLLPRLLPRRALFAVPAAGIAGIAFPGCECGSVPIAGRLVARGTPAPAALTFLLAAPAINPVVLVATAVAFPGRPAIVAARFCASLLAAIVVGLIWSRVGRSELTDRPKDVHEEGASRLETFVETVQHDFLHAGGFLVVGALAAATLQTVVPRSVLDSLAGSGAVAVATMAVLAVVLAVCSEADAFVAASLAQFSLVSRLVFMVVGPAVDIKLIALQAGVFGREFAMRFAPLTLAVTIASALVVGWLVL